MMISTPLSSPAAKQELPTLSVAELDKDPHGIYRRYRHITPMVCREDGSYIVLRARDVEGLLSNPRLLKKGVEFAESRGFTDGPIYNVFRHSMLMANGEEHRRRRGPVTRTFAFRMIAGLRPRIRAVAEELIDAHYANGEMNILDDYAALIPARTISDILGVPASDISQFATWTYAVTRALSFSFQPSELPGIRDSSEKLTNYVAGLLAERRTKPQDDFLTKYVQAADSSGVLSPEEVLAQVMTLILAGSDTTRGAMAIQTSLLLQHREQWDAICQDVALIPGAVTESLRYEPSVGGTNRFPQEDIEIDGHLVPANSLLTLSTMSAMRDPEVYAEPDRFNIRRTDHPRWHFVFGGGAHRCLGEALARAELEEGLFALAARLPNLEIQSEPSRMLEHGAVRPITPMRVAWKRT